MSDFNTLDSLLRNIPSVYNKTMGTVISNADPNKTYRQGASNLVGTLDAVSWATDKLFQAISDGIQQSLIGVSPVKLNDISEINTYVDEKALPGYFFEVNQATNANGEILGYPRNLSRSFYLTIKNTNPSTDINLSFGSFLDSSAYTSARFHMTTDGIYFYISDPLNCTITKTSSTGFPIVTWKAFNSPSGSDTFAAPYGLVCYSDYIFIADHGNCRIVKLNKYGEFLAEWGTYGTGDTNLKYPSDIKTDGTYLYVADFGNSRIVKLDLDLTPGPYIATWGTPGTGNTNLSAPQSLTVNGTDLYICDTNNSRIVKIPTTLAPGPYTAAWGTLGTGDTNLNYPESISNDGSYLYISDTQNHRVGKLSIPLFAIPTTPFNLTTVISTPTLYGTEILNSVLYVGTAVNEVLLFNTDTLAQIYDYNFGMTTPMIVTIPGGGYATIQYRPNDDNPNGTPGTYTLIYCSDTSLGMQQNFNVTNDFGSDETSVVFPPNCIEQIGLSYNVRRFKDEVSDYTYGTNNYKSRIKLQTFGGKITPVNILFFLKKLFPDDSNLKVYECFTQEGVNTGFSNAVKNTSNTDLYNLIDTYTGTYSAYELDSNTGILTNVPSFKTFVQNSPPFYIYVTFSSGLFENRGVYSGGSGSIGSIYDLFNETGSDQLTTTFHSSRPQGAIGPSYATYGGFLDTELYSASSAAQRMAFLINAVKAAGITAVIVQLD